MPQTKPSGPLKRKAVTERALQRWARSAADYVRAALKFLFVVSLLTMAIFFNRIVYSVYSGQMGVKWSRFSGGTVLERSYEEGVHLIWPWDEFTIYDMREQEAKNETLVYARDGLEIKVRTSIRFRPTAEFLPRLHQDIGPKYVEKVVKPEVVSTLRKVLGNFTPEMIYAKDEEGLLAELGRTLRDDLDTAYFEVTEFLVLELRLPEAIEAAIKLKLGEEQKMLSYRFRLDRERDEKKRRIIEAEGVRAFEAISGMSLLRWRGIEATEKLAESPNTKIVLMGTGEGQLPVILNADASPAPPAAAVAKPLVDQSSQDATATTSDEEQ